MHAQLASLVLLEKYGTELAQEPYLSLGSPYLVRKEFLHRIGFQCRVISGSTA